MFQARNQNLQHLKHQKHITDSLLVQYWSSTLKLQLILLVFLRATCYRTLVLYIQSLDKLTTWLFAFDQTNDARYMLTFGIRIRSLNFQEGNFVIHKSSNLSSGMSIDQTHKNNKMGEWIMRCNESCITS